MVGFLSFSFAFGTYYISICFPCVLALVNVDLNSCDGFSTVIEIVVRFLASGKAAEYGVLKDGYNFNCSTGLSRM